MRRVTSVTRKAEAQSFLSVVCKAVGDLGKATKNATVVGP
jgi:hypothetical protein